MHFKAGSQEPKATVQIGEKTYKIMAPSLGQADAFSEKVNSLKGNPDEISAEMKKYICMLGSIPMEELNNIENDMFVELFSYVQMPKKK